jgi:hypothetical protein
LALVQFEEKMSLTKHCKEEVAVWRTGACAGEFGDAFIKDTNLEGEETHYALFIGEIETDCQVLL